MISSLEGVLRYKSPDEVVVECGGVGYGVMVPLSTYGSLPDVGESIHLLVHTHVREDALQLYGFLRAVEKVLFRKLITISGVGPRLAIGIMSGLPSEELVDAIRSGDVKRLTRVPGVGKKTAERVVLELSDKLTELAEFAPPSGKAPGPAARRNPVGDDVVSALTNLGYRAADAETAVEKAGDTQDFESLLREALKLLGR